MGYIKRPQFLKQEQEENTCEICGASNALIRDRTCYVQRVENGRMRYWPSGFTCHNCIDEGKELDHVNNMLAAKDAEEKEYKNLLDELENLYRSTNGTPDADDVKNITIRLDELGKSQKDRDQLERRFVKARNERISDFQFKYGPKVEEKYCKICGCDKTYLCVVQSTCENNIHTWYHLSAWACSDCVIFGKMDTYIERELSELLTFMKEWQYIKEKNEFFKSILGKSQFSEKEINSYVSTYKNPKELERKKAMYDSREFDMMCDMAEYEFIDPVIFVIEPTKVGDSCVFCDEKYGEDFKCDND